MGIFSREANSAKFSGQLWCPICAQNLGYDPRKQVWKLDRWITSTLVRYICKKCKTPVRYEISRNAKPSAAELTKYGLVGR